MKNTIMMELQNEAETDLTIDRSELDRESLRTPNLHNKWLRKLYDRKDKIFAFELLRKKTLRDKTLYYTGKAPDDVYTKDGAFNLRVMKQDLPLFLDADDSIQGIDIKIHTVKQEIEFIQKTLEEINRRSFHITNAIKAIAFMNGQNI